MSKNSKLQTALWYAQNGFSVIPVNNHKVPYLKTWAEWQDNCADEDQLQLWWKKWPNANIAIVTGKISGVTVVDADSDAGRKALEEFISDSMQTPVVKTPKGYHYYFQFAKGISNRVRVLEDCDVRNDGGYVVAPPSANGNGDLYSWVPGLDIKEVRPAPMPEFLRGILAAPAGQTHARKNDHASSISKAPCSPKPLEATGDYSKLQIFKGRIPEGVRDNTLFHIAHHLFNGHMPVNEIEQLLLLINTHCCDPPEQKSKINEKIKSVLKRAQIGNRNIAAEAREWALATTGHWETIRGQTELQLTTKRHRLAANAEWQRMAKSGEIRRYGDKRGSYYTPDAECEPEDWKNAPTGTVKIWLPFELDKMMEIPPGSILLFAGSQDAGKSALMMNIARWNMHQWKVNYFSSELNASSFKNRMLKFPGITLDMFNIQFYQRSSNLVDVIKPGEGNLNIIDYLEIHDQFYLVSKHLAEIHDRLDGAIAVVALQKDPKALYGRGGSFTQEKPILSVSVDRGFATISKFKGEWNGNNPNGKQYRFKIVNGCELIKVQDWYLPAT